MTDRELLELAAKAAGLPHQWCDAWNTMAKPRPDSGFFFNKIWNPLTNDGDAFRLAVKLRLEPRFLDLDHPAGPPRVTFHNVAGLVELAGNDLMAATRRAIVRAAAEIGRAEK
jgi:hypothetical protein